MASSIALAHDTPLAPLTTLDVGGPARFFTEVHGTDELLEALRFAHESRLDVLAMGDGSNMLVADAGFGGLVVRMRDELVAAEPIDERFVRIRVGAGVEWDGLAAFTVGEGYAGLECLSGIPGRAGAAPIQNIGAYGHEIAECLEAVHAVECTSGRRRRLAPRECGFGYRWSRFKGEWNGQFVITGLELRLRRNGPASVRYEELRRVLGMTETTPPPPLAAVREAVLATRKSKSMLLDPADPNRRSAGSFFVNPQVPSGEAERIRRTALARGIQGRMPAHSAGEGLVKLSAAWLIEGAGFHRGFVWGRVGLSSNHVLALINRGGATAAEVAGLAALIQETVVRIFGVELTAEPVFVGFGEGSAA